LAFFDHVARATTGIEVGGVQWHIHVSINRGGEVAGGDGAFLDVTAISFAGSDDLPVPARDALSIPLRFCITKPSRTRGFKPVNAWS
jgi:hypothetical protein